MGKDKDLSVFIKFIKTCTVLFLPVVFIPV